MAEGAGRVLYAGYAGRDVTGEGRAVLAITVEPRDRKETKFSQNCVQDRSSMTL